MDNHYKVGNTTKSGDVISHIYGCVENHIVFRDDKKHLKWETNCPQDVYSKAVNKFNILYSKVSSSLPQDIHDSILSDLAMALHHSFSGENIDVIDELFEGAEERITNTLSPNQAKLRLVLYCLLSSTILIVLLFATFVLTGDAYNSILYCAGAGILGGTLSLMQRNAEISINLEDGNLYIFLQATFIPILGMLSGCCFYFISKSDLAFSFASDNIYSLITLSIIAGFSERFVPDLFQNAVK